VLVGVGQQLVQKAVGRFQFEDAVSGQEWRQTFLPIVVAAFDFTLGLGCWGEPEGDAVEVQGRAQLGQRVGGVGEENGVIVDVECQWQAVGLEGAGEKVEMCQQVFMGIEAGAQIVTGGIVEDIEQGLLVGIVWQPGVGAGVILPECPQIAGLPAFHGFGDLFVTGVWGQLVLAGPAADAGAVGFEVESAMEFAGGRTVRRRRFGGKQFGQQGGDFVGPLGMVITAGTSGGPGLTGAFGASGQILAIQFKEAGAREPQFSGGSARQELCRAILGKDVTDERGWETFEQL